MRDNVYLIFAYIKFCSVFKISFEDVISAILFTDNTIAMHKEIDTLPSTAYTIN